MTEATMPALGTQSHRPDLNWSQVRETVLMIELCSGQIEAALKDSNSSVEVLTDVFTSMAGYMRMISDSIGKAAVSSPEGGANTELQIAASNVTDMISKAIIAFQFYDKLVQRLSHVNHSLASLSALISDSSRLYTPSEWAALQGKIRSRYTMQEEVQMFDAVLGGMPVKEALEQFVAQMKDHSNDIELF